MAHTKEERVNFNKLDVRIVESLTGLHAIDASVGNRWVTLRMDNGVIIRFKKW